MPNNFQAPRGMHDVLAADLQIFEKIEKSAVKLAHFYGFAKLQTPILEDVLIFEKGTGITSDIVEKEMYTLRTKGGDYLALRPELTPGIVRAYLERGLQAEPKPVNLWSVGPVFRYERPQSGRYRQFTQIDFESLGAQEPVIDAIIVQISYNFLKELGFNNLIIEVNSIGDKQCRPYFKKSLSSYLRSRQNSLCADCKRRLKKNPLRILDCKEEKCQRIKSSAPQFIDHLCKDCHSHFKSFLEFLDEMQLPYTLNPYLVRGLDYYTKTVFEIYEDTPDGRSQGALAGGGRYDDLVKVLGGKETPACGVALGMERLANLIKRRGVKLAPEETAEFFLAQVGDLAKRKALNLLEEFRKEKINIASSIQKDSLSAQLKLASKLGAKYVLILGQKEALDSQIIFREMQSGKQTMIALDKAVSAVKKKTK